ncbi:hypothetical protein ACTXT7_008481 [Hymenolepis weldensis]
MRLAIPIAKEFETPLRPYDAKPLSVMSKRAHRFPLFCNRLVSPEKHICAHVLARPYPSDSYKALFVFHSITTHAGHLRAPTLPAHLLSSSARSPLSLSLSLSLSLTRFKPRCGFLEYILA